MTHIAILVEGATEKAFKTPLLSFLTPRLAGRMPKLDFMKEDGRIPKEYKLKRRVELLLNENDAVIALTDVYTGGNPKDFKDANDAKTKMRNWVGQEARFFPHVAQYEFEAWLFPFWPEVQRLAGTNRPCPSSNPETVNHDNPPSRHLAEIFKTGSTKRRSSKTRDATAILSGQDLSVSARHCPELREFLNTILDLSGGQKL